jgi:hypothetical protein
MNQGIFMTSVAFPSSLFFSIVTLAWSFFFSWKVSGSFNREGELSHSQSRWL